MKKQVEKEHYLFSKYMNKRRWCSVWHQLDEVLSLQPDKVLEVGPGSGMFKVVAEKFGLNVDTLDISEDLNPDIVASATEMPIADNSYDLVCSFQMLEHLPIEMSLAAFKEMARVSRNTLVISLPDAEPCWPYSIYIPRVGQKSFHIKNPFLKIKKHEFDGEHYWEINKKGYELNSIQKWLLDAAQGFELANTYRVPEIPYHRFFIYKRKC
ncbi:MAG: class I SAM-dependent methyltransferase [Gammaproteobacteria bacterium]|nr:class I SAM-dependent methyltransferase [Gammaproteobacteria bacterium]